MEISFFYTIFLLFISLYFLSKHFVQRKNKLPPSPGLSLPIIGHLYLFKKPIHRTLAVLSNKYSPILFMNFGSRPVVLVSSPAAAEECFTKNDIIFANRPKLLAGKHLGYDYTTLIWAPYGNHWRNLRRVASIELLSSNRLHMLSNIRVEEVRSLVFKLFRGSKGKEFQTFNMKSMFFELTLNVIMRMIAGKRYNFGENTEEQDEERRFKDIITESLQLSEATNMGDFLPVLRWIGLNKMEKKLVELQRKRDRFMQDLIEEHKRERSGCGFLDNENKNKSMVDVLLGLQEDEPNYYTDEIIRGMMQVLLSAGSDTSAGTMEWTLSLMLNNPNTLEKARAEIDNNIGQNKFIEEFERANLPYLHCIITETLRMKPTGPLLLPHQSSEECTVGGFYVPRGTMLLVNTFAIQNDPNLWEDAAEFKPERFEGKEGKKEGYAFIAFGAGRRGCPGEGLAIKMIGLALATLIQCFEWERVSPEMVNMEEGSGLSMPKAHPLLAKCRPRHNSLDLLSRH
uniref:Cytochrome p450 n=1 Tax=Croton stellatopilosus TaxID=431156 RepID=A0A3G2CJX8_9ROSI|nr:cytochrome p450 [Croton stellatopilosus]